MVASSWRGHAIIAVGDHWEYEDNGVSVIKDPRRACGKCSMPSTTGCDDDPCLGHLPGVMNACCGHGKREDSYIQFDSGLCVRGFIVDDAATEEPDAPTPV